MGGITWKIPERIWRYPRAFIEHSTRLSPSWKIRLWKMLGKPVSPPTVYKADVIRTLAKRYDILTFVETGTWHGDMVAAQIEHFEHIYSIELGEELYQVTKEKFASNNNVNLFQGNSSKVLPILLTRIYEPVLFWLDAHWSGGDTVKMSDELHTPIRQELEAIFAHDVHDHVILIDDARAFLGESGWSTIDELRLWVTTERPEMSFEIMDDVIYITP